MRGQSGHATTAGPPHGWSLSFAREPEPDLELDDAPEGEGGSHASGSQKPPGRRPATLVLLLLLVAVGAYIAMDPGLLLNLLGMGEEETAEAPAPPPAPTAKAPAPPLSVAPAAPGSPAPSGQAPPPTVQPPRTAASPPPPTPLYREGQRVTVVADPVKPGPVALQADAAGTKPGPTVAPGSALTVVDGELRGSAWIYAVKTMDGAVGWVPEAKLKAKS
jgi:hypothetical protein